MMVTDTLLLSTLGVKFLPVALLLSSLFTLSSSLSYTALLGRFQSLQLLQGTLGLLGILLVGGFLGLKAGSGWLCLPLLALYGTSFSMVATQSFGLASECIDTYSSKRLFPVLTVAATCGELLGGLLVAGGARWIDPAGWVLAWAGCNFLALTWLWAHRERLKQWRHTTRSGRQQPGAVLQYLRSAPMARSLTILLLGMILCQGTSQYLFSQVFARSFPQARDLAYFLGSLVALTNLAELVIATQLTPRLVGWLGVARAAWLHPLLMLSGLIGLSLQFQLGPAMWLWICRRTLQDSLATPVRNLLYNAIPARVRAHLRTFLDGVVVSCAQACVALLLLVLQRQLAPNQISYVGVILALVYWAGAFGASRNYLRTLVGELEVQGLRLQPRSTSVHLTGSQILPSRSLREWEIEMLEASSAEGSADAMEALAWHSDPLALQMLARGLALPHPWQRQGAAHRLGALGEPGVRAALPYLFSDQFATVEAALQVLGESRTAWAGALLQDQFASRARAAARAWLAGYQMRADGLPERFLKEALSQESGRHRRLAFEVLRWLEGQELVETLRLSLLSQGGRSASALEVLSNLGDRQVAQLFVTLLEPNSDQERGRLLLEALGKGGASVAALSDDPWVRWASLKVRQPWELGKMEQLLALRQTRPFHRLDLDQLELVRLRMLEERFESGQVFWHKGEPVKRGFVLIQGEQEREFLGGVELAGQMPARCDLITDGPVRMLSLSKSQWEQIILELPALALGTFQWLSAELRRSETAA